MNGLAKGILKIGGGVGLVAPLALCLGFGVSSWVKGVKEQDKIGETYFQSQEWKEQEEVAEKRLEVIEEQFNNGQLNHNDYFNEKRYFENSYIYGSWRKYDDCYLTACLKDSEHGTAYAKAEHTELVGQLVSILGGLVSLVPAVLGGALIYDGIDDIRWELL